MSRQKGAPKNVASDAEREFGRRKSEMNDKKVQSLSAHETEVCCVRQWHAFKLDTRPRRGLGHHILVLAEDLRSLFWSSCRMDRRTAGDFAAQLCDWRNMVCSLSQVTSGIS